MRRYEAGGPRFRIQRALGVELPGLGKAGALDKRAYPPGQHGQRRIKLTPFAERLAEKQKILAHYCVREAQLKRYVRNAKRKKGNWMPHLIETLERRLDNVVFRLGFAPSIPSARQLVTHGHVQINGVRRSIPSEQVKLGAKVSLGDKALALPVVLQAKAKPRMQLADFLEKEEQHGREVGHLKLAPTVDNVPFPFRHGLVIEFYSKLK